MTDILICGEAWGADEEKQRLPFVGVSGNELTRMLSEAGIRRADCYLTNVFNLRPNEKNDIEALCVSAKEPHITSMPYLRAGKYIRREYLPEIERLYKEIEDVKPNLVLALGGTAAWATLHNSAISKLRGTVSLSHNGKYKVLPTYHPAAILRDWSLRHVTVIDLIKAERESHYPDIRRPPRTAFIEPSLGDLHDFERMYIDGASALAFDIETYGDQITCIGFAPSPAVCIVVPFVDHRKPKSCYWPTLEEELAAWAWVRKILASSIPKIAQNALYDVTFLWRYYGIPTINLVHDTMLLHHSLQPESLKGLAFLGSVYSDESAWKTTVRHTTTIKRDD